MTNNINSLQLGELILSWALGLGLGITFFILLWWTVRKGLDARHPGSWFLSSMLLRMSLALAGFYLVGDGQWPRILACLCGFVLAKFVSNEMLKGRITVKREIVDGP